MSENEAQSGSGDGAADDWAAAMDEQKASAPAAEEKPAGAADDWGDALSEQKAASAEAVDSVLGTAPAATAAAVPEFDAAAALKNVDADANLDLLLDVPVTVAMEIGRVQVPIRNLLQLTQGSVVELDRLAGEPLDVTVNGTLIAHGEVVVVNERYGIRFTDVISAAERVKKLK